jgi:dTDP-4-dehydrorhamnose reductase
MRIAVVGARGQLGRAMVHECSTDHDVVALDRAALDITDHEAVMRRIGELRPAAIVNCTGYNFVDDAETHAVEALRVNAFGVCSLARAAQESGAALVHFSTDFVFDGTASAPMTEAHPPNPRSAYAASKLLGEWFAADAPAWYVLRVESLFGAAPGAAGKGSVEAILDGLRAGRVVRLFRDRTVSPTCVADAATATRTLLERRAEPGLYHCVNSGFATWLEVGLEAARLLGVTPQLDAVTLADVKLKAERPRYCALSNEKLQAALGYALPPWQDALARYVRERA